MVYSNKFVMCVLVNNQIQKELNNGTVPIPFGVEYTLRFRNKNSRRAVVKFYIDGEDVSGNGYIIPGNSHIDIKRYSNKDESFRFVPLDSQEAIDQGKNGPNLDKVKGLIEAKFYLEKQCYFKNNKNDNYYWNYLNGAPSTLCDYKYTSTTFSESKPYTITYNKDTISLSSNDINKINIALNDGATVPGSSTGQFFSNVYIDIEEDYVKLKLFLQGIEENYNNKINEYELIKKQNQDLKNQIKEEQEKLKLKELIEENKKLKEELEKLRSRQNPHVE